MNREYVFRTPAVLFMLILAVCLGVLPATGALNTIPASGTAFIGEEGLDISATGVTPDSQIAWYGPNGRITDVPSATVTVADPTDFYISPATFSGKTGPWFALPSKTLAFYVQDPTIDVRVYDYTLSFEITPSANWLPAGDSAGFRIETNLFEMANRPGVSGAPVTIRLKGPDGVEYSSLGSYSLQDIPVSKSPQETGPVWNTGSKEFPRGTYSVSAECNANSMKDNYPQTGRTISTPVTFVMQATNPLIATPTTDQPVITITATSETTAPTPTKTTIMTTELTTPPTQPPTTQPETTIPPTTPTPTPAPGFGIILALSGAIIGLVLVKRLK